MSEIKQTIMTQNQSLSEVISFTHAPKTDTISEKTSGSGVTIDSVLLKEVQFKVMKYVIYFKRD